MLRRKWIRVYIKEGKTLCITYAGSPVADRWQALTTAPINDLLLEGKDIHHITKEERTNAMLIHLRNTTYMYVGQEVFTFDASDEIVEMISEEGSANTPFSVALGKNNIYFLTEKMSIDREIFNEFAQNIEHTLLAKSGYRRFDNLVGKKATVVYRMLYEFCRIHTNNIYNLNILSTML
tara:strand:- start:152 stop:688 length:537 start_codon:yes stop_codon:yes gene_type:complete